MASRPHDSAPPLVLSCGLRPLPSASLGPSCLAGPVPARNGPTPTSPAHELHASSSSSSIDRRALRSSVCGGATTWRLCTHTAPVNGRRDATPEAKNAPVARHLRCQSGCSGAPQCGHTKPGKVLTGRSLRSNSGPKWPPDREHAIVGHVSEERSVARVVRRGHAVVGGCPAPAEGVVGGSVSARGAAQLVRGGARVRAGAIRSITECRIQTAKACTCTPTSTATNAAVAPSSSYALSARRIIAPRAPMCATR